MRIVADGAADIPQELIDKYNIYVMPINVMFGQEEFLAGPNLDHPQAMSHSEFYAKAEKVTDENWPKTSQPTPYQYIEAYEKMIAAGETEFLTITVSEKLSGTYASAVMAHKELADKATFHLVDSETGSVAFGWQVTEAARLEAEGADLDTILARIDEVKSKTVTAFMIDNLEFAVRGGRVSSWRSTVASLLRIKPIMTVKDGLVVEENKVRSHRKALRYLVDYAKERVADRPVRAAVVWGGNPENGEELRDQVLGELNVVDFQFLEMAISISVNMGPGAVALFTMPVD